LGDRGDGRQTHIRPKSKKKCGGVRLYGHTTNMPKKQRFGANGTLQRGGQPRKKKPIGGRFPPRTGLFIGSYGVEVSLQIAWGTKRGAARKRKFWSAADEGRNAV